MRGSGEAGEMRAPKFLGAGQLLFPAKHLAGKTRQIMVVCAASKERRSGNAQCTPCVLKISWTCHAGDATSQCLEMPALGFGLEGVGAGSPLKLFMLPFPRVGAKREICQGGVMV
jgi:hypothetical protein